MKRPKNSTSDIAVALHYDGSNAPTVTAKGRDQLARRIMQVAQEHGVPLHEDEYLVQVLSTIELGDEIPENLYRAVAEVIAFAYYLSGRVPGDQG
jgi:flagellar biosynthesis protein